MAPLSLKIVLDEGAVTRTVMFESSMRVDQAQAIVKEKILTADDGKEYGLFLTSADDEKSGIFLERHRNLDYYMLRDGDQLHYLCRVRNLRVRMLDGSVKTLPVDEAKTVELLMVDICARIGITNHDEYSLCHDGDEEQEKLAPGTGTLTLRRVAQHRERDAKMEQLRKKLKTDDNVEWLDQHKTLREQGIDAKETLLLKRRLFYTDRNVDARDPVQLNLLYVQTRNAILEGRHPVTEDQASDCKVRWINIRDVNRRILKKNLTHPRSPQRVYKYESELSFMKPYYKDVAITESEDRSQWDDGPDEACDAPVDSDDSEKSVKKSTKASKKSKKRKKWSPIVYDEEEEEPLSTLSEQPSVSDFDPSDPVDAFLLSIGATLKTFSPYHLNLAKSKIFSVVQEHDLQQIVQKTSDVKSDTDALYLG